MWVPVHDEEWDGDVPIGPLKRSGSVSPGKESEKGYVVFKGSALPWQVGQYEVRDTHLFCNTLSQAV
jgi:phosphatidylethanolamine N-methyltransferase